MEVVVAEKVAEKAVDGLIDSIWRQIGYIWNYKSNMEDLRKQLKKLKADKKEILQQVSEARNKGEEIEEIVKNWLESADEAVKAAYEILQLKEGGKGSCFMGCHPDLKTRYLFSRKAKKEMLPNVADVRREKNFDRIGYRIAVQDLEFPKHYEVIESRTLVLGKLVEALKDGAVSMIGLYGLGGVGKSTLLKQLTSHVKEDGLFTVVATATVTHTPDRKEIQKQLAEWLDFPLDVDSPDIRATKLRSRLQKEDKILVILDDMWAEHLIKLEDIGIPYGDDHKGCKVLMSSRNQDVLLQMQVKEDFSFCLQALTDEEARFLFQKTVGTLEDRDQIQPILIEVAKRCGGLPLLIQSVATALRGKQLFEWKDALEDLQSFNDNGLEGQVYKALMLSFKFLKDDQKSLLLLCSQLRPHHIAIRDLLKYSIGLGLFNQHSRSLLTIESVQNRLLTVVSQLKKSCLLMEGDRNRVVKMHDIVHAFAASVAYDELHVFNGSYRTKLEEWPDDDTFEQCTAISLPNCIFPQLPQVLKCQQLQSFIVYSNDRSLKIPNDLFSAMKILKLVDLSNLNLSTLPSSLQFLENLATLCLDNCDLEDISAIGKLKNLRVLSLICSTIYQLPSELSELTRLQWLDLSSCDCLEVIPQDVLSCLKKLEYLLMGNSFLQWQGEGHTGETNNVNLVELKLLSNLINLEIQILDPKILPSDLFSEKLERFRIFIGNDWDWDWYWDWDWSGKYETSTMLKLKINMLNQLEKIKVPLTKTEDLYLDDLKGFKNVLPELDGKGFPKLKHLNIQNSHDIQYIIDWQRMGHVIAFCRLESLSLHNLNNVKEISHGKFTNGCFDNLRKLKVENCNELTCLFSFSMFKCLVQLQEISVRNCQSMKAIVAIKYEDDEDKGDVKDETIELSKLCTLTLEELPQFAGFCAQIVPTDEASREILLVDESEKLTSKKIQFPSLVDLKLSSINVERIWHNQMIEMSSFEKLTTLIVDGCIKLAYTLTSSMVGSLGQLKHIEICDCNSMEEVITTEGAVEEVVLPRLDFLKLKGLPKLQRFVASNFINCPSLRVLRIENCPLLRAFRDAGWGTSSKAVERDSILIDEKVLFLNLEEICITYMHKLKMIWNEELGSDSFCRLKVVRVEHCKALSKVFPPKQLRRFKNVESVFVKNCDSLEEVFDLRMLIKSKERHASQLRTLFLENLPKLIHIWNGDSQGILSFHNLSKVKVMHCLNLGFLFPTSVGRNLLQLEEIYSGRCGLKEIIEKKEDELESTMTFAFPRLKRLYLFALQQLTSFYKQNHTLDCPELKTLTVQGCDQLELFALKPQDQDQLRLKSQFQQPFFSFITAPNLEELSLNGRDMSILRQGHFPIGSLLKLKVLRLQHFDNSTELPFDLLCNFHEIHTLCLIHSDLEELFPNDIMGEVGITLGRIRDLVLVRLPRMKHVCKQGSQPLRFLPNLEGLRIMFCNNLISLEEFSASFHNLSFLYVHSCDAMLNLASCSAISGLVSLTTMAVSGCKNMREIIVTSEDENKSQFQSDEIIFKKLKTLSLDSLEKLTSFCSASCTIKFPSLKQMNVVKCPRMKIFSRGVVTAPYLKGVYVTEEAKKSHWIGDLNTTMKHLSTQMVGFNGLQVLKLSEYPLLKQAWHDHDQLPVNFFYNLRELRIDDCPDSTVSVSSNLLPFLNNLEYLEVTNCNSVEQVFGLPSLNGKEFLGYLTNLNRLDLIGLPRLRCIFQSSMWRSLLNLETLRIVNCELVEQVFDFQELINADINRKLECRLGNLIIDDLSNLKHIWNVDFSGSVLFHKLNLVEVWRCPYLNNIFPASVASDLPQLETLHIDGCAVEELVAKVEGVDATPRFVFPQLEILHLRRLEKLKCLYKGNHTLECPKLKELNVYQCDSLQNVGTEYVNLQDKDMDIKPLFPFFPIVSPCQKHPEIFPIDVENMWNTSFFKSLTSLKIFGCSNLKYIFSLSIVESFVHLEELEICNCERMEDVVIMETFGETTPSRMVYKQLKSLKLINLPKLLRFCMSDLLECPSLKELSIQNCPQLISFVSNSASTEVDISKSALFDEKVALPILEKMEICDMDNMEILWHNSLGSNSFAKLKGLKLIQVKQLVKIFPSKMWRSLQNLEELVIENCESVKVVFDFQDLKNADFDKTVESQLRKLHLENLQNLRHIWNKDPLEFVLFNKLKSVYVWECPSLNHVFPASVASDLPHLEILNIERCAAEELVYQCDSLQIFGSEDENQKDMGKLPFFSFLQDSHPNQVLQTLETLIVYACDNLLHLAPSFASFGNLMTLNVERCHGIVSLLTSSTAKSLVQLTKMEIKNCKKVREVIANEGDEGEEEIVFIKLESLELTDLPSLICFCSEDHSFKFPALTQVTLEECPNMQFFCKGNWAMPILENDKKNDTIHKLYTKQHPMEI